MSFQFLDPVELDGKKLVKLTKYYKSKILGSGRSRELTKVLTHVGFSFPVSIPTVSGRSKIVVDQTLCMNSP